MSRSESDNKILYITKKGELLLWLIVVLLFTCIYSCVTMDKEIKDNDYQIFMHDVDGLIVGSPVRMMGIEVGHVTKIKPTNDEVYVKFIITDENIVLPQGTQATVEFSGMAGSKSLELYLPDEKIYIDSNTPMLSVSAPKRLHDAAGLLNDMFHRIGTMITTTSMFGDNLKKNVELPKGGSSQDMQEFLKYADKMVDESNNMAENFRRKLNHDKQR